MSEQARRLISGLCPFCGADDHKLYTYNETLVYACPSAPNDKAIFYSIGASGPSFSKNIGGVLTAQRGEGERKP